MDDIASEATREELEAELSKVIDKLERIEHEMGIEQSIIDTAEKLARQAIQCRDVNKELHASLKRREREILEALGVFGKR